MSSLLSLVLAVAIDGEAALRHASALASLGPHPFGSPRNEAAALYVAASLRSAGISEVELQRFEREGVRGTNVVATLRGAGEGFVLVSAHHDSAPGSPGACDDGGGVGVLLEVARVLAAEPSRDRTFVFASFDGEEAETMGRGITAGSRAYLEGLGARGRSLVAALAIEMSGWSGGRPVLHAIAYPDPRRNGRAVIAPGALVAAALAGARDGGSSFSMGDPYLSWLYQPAVRTFRVRLYGDDLSLLQQGYPALMTSDSSFSRFYPAYHRPQDTADRLSDAALQAMGRAALGSVRALARMPRGSLDDSDWFAAFGRVFGRPWLVGVGVLSLLPVVASGVSVGGAPLLLRLTHAALFGVLLWRVPVPALWVFLVPNMLAPARKRWLVSLLSLAPTAMLVALGTAAWRRGAVSGVWLAPWEIAAALLGLALSLFTLPAARRQGAGRARKPPGSPRRKGR